MRGARGASLACLLALALAAAAWARPERIRPGHSHYSDESVTRGLVRDIGPEKNYEEVYQFYAYYEAVYDERGRVTTFKEYERGSVILVERYRYSPSGELLERIVQRPGEAPEAASPGAPGGSEPAESSR
jgi:hypothetical protein